MTFFRAEVVCDKQTTTALQNKIDEPFTFEILPDLKTIFDMSFETFSLLFAKL